MPAKRRTVAKKKKSSSALYKSRLANLKKARAVRARNLGKSSARSTTKAPVRRRRRTVKAPVRRSRSRKVGGSSEDRLIKTLIKYDVIHGKPYPEKDYYPIKSTDALLKDFQAKQRKVLFDPNVKPLERASFYNTQEQYILDLKNLKEAEELKKMANIKPQGVRLAPVPPPSEVFKEGEFEKIRERIGQYGGKKERKFLDLFSLGNNPLTGKKIEGAIPGAPFMFLPERE